MFRRGGNTPKMSHFFGRTNSVSSVPEEDEDAGKHKEAFSNLVECLYKWPTFISRIFLKIGWVTF